MNAHEIRKAYLDFFAKKQHTVIPRANLVPLNDPTTLFTGSGMQPLLPYLLGEEHPAGTRLVDSQTCLRAEDIEEVGDNRHTTFFEMLGNWSLGEYFKEKQIPWMFEFLVDVVGLDPNRIYTTCFIGAPEYDIPKDTEAAELWQKLFTEKGIKAEIADIGSEQDGYKRGIKPGERIFYYDGSKNWWNRGKTGPATTPVGDPCGPDSEMFYDFGTEHDPAWGDHCHPNCDCGRFMEIGNNVFMAYQKVDEGKFVPLASPNIDHGSGLERIAAAAIHNPDAFKISLMWPIIEGLEQLTGKTYAGNEPAMRVIADHLRAATFLVTDGVAPSNKEQGYVVRRLMRRAIRFAFDLGIENDLITRVVPIIVDLYADDFPEIARARDDTLTKMQKEEKSFRQTLQKGLKEFHESMTDGYWVKLPEEYDTKTASKGEIRGKMGRYRPGKLPLIGELVFKMQDTYGFPAELTIEEAAKTGYDIDPKWRTAFDAIMSELRDMSRTAIKGQFKGGLGGQTLQHKKYHTATHLLQSALREIFGPELRQHGSNITEERLRFDFNLDRKVTPEEIARAEELVNGWIKDDLPVSFQLYPTQEALDMGAIGPFGERYDEQVKVYKMGEDDHVASLEICGGPHVDHTAQLGEGDKVFKITKEEASSAGIRRIKAVLV